MSKLVESSEMENRGRARYVIATIKSWNIKAAKRFDSANSEAEALLITDRKDLTYQKIKAFGPRYVFFPHWSWIIPPGIFENSECVVFHMTDLPFGRGGSPLQNLIERGIYQTKISAIRVVEELDAGPVYLKRDLSLQGSAAQIFKRASRIIFEDMIPYIIQNEPTPVPQVGDIVRFQRRTPEQGDIANLTSLTEVYDYIRMLDAEGYPPAFAETSGLKIEFSNAKLEKDYVLAKARIRIRNEL